MNKTSNDMKEKIEDIIYKNAFDDNFDKQHIIYELLDLFGVSHCACTPDETTGSTAVQCCNICGKPTESWWRCG